MFILKEAFQRTAVITTFIDEFSKAKIPEVLQL